MGIEHADRPHLAGCHLLSAADCLLEPELLDLHRGEVVKACEELPGETRPRRRTQLQRFD